MSTQKSVIKGRYLDKTHRFVLGFLYITFGVNLLFQELVMNIFITVMKLLQLLLSLFAYPLEITRIDEVLITEIPFIKVSSCIGEI